MASSATAAAARVVGSDAAGLAEAAAALRAGRLVAFPTETVYGLGADAASPPAVARIYAAKGRPAFNPLIVHVATPREAVALGDFSDAAKVLAAAFWPGPLTLVVPARADGPVCDLARAGLATIALRCPAGATARAILDLTGRPVAAPSANRSGRVSPTSAEHVAADLGGRVDLIVDGGPCAVGVESTILALLDGDALLLRPGGLPRADIERVLGHRLATPRAADRADAPMAPGRLASHYAPRTPLRLRAVSIRPGEAALDFGGRLAGEAVARRDLSPAGDTLEAAARLYADLRALDRAGASAIAVAPIPDEGLGEAINDRLSRAAAPRGE